MKSLNSLNKKSNLGATKVATTTTASATVDKLCSVSNTINSTCYLTNKTIGVIGNFQYSSNYSLVFSNTTMSCDKSSSYCTISITLLKNNSLTLVNGTNFSAK